MEADMARQGDAERTRAEPKADAPRPRKRRVTRPPAAQGPVAIPDRIAATLALIGLRGRPGRV
jgi:hypothetical protein